MTELPPLLPARRLSWQFLRLAAPYWNSADKWRVRGYTALLLLFTLAQVGLAIWMSYWSRALFDALEDKSLNALLVQIGTFVLIFLLTMAVTRSEEHTSELQSQSNLVC